MSDENLDLAGVTVLVRHAGSQWHVPEIATYRDETQLEVMLADQPSLLPGSGPGAVAVRQLYVPDTGPLDVLAIDTSGQLTICECKLALHS